MRRKRCEKLLVLSLLRQIAEKSGEFCHDKRSRSEGTRSKNGGTERWEQTPILCDHPMKEGIYICFENGIVEYFNVTKRIGCVHHRFDRLFVFVVFAGDRLQIAVFDNERCERVVVKEKGIAVLERVFGSFCEEFSSDLERREVF